MSFIEKKGLRGNRNNKKSNKIVCKFSLGIIINLIEYSLTNSVYFQERNMVNLKKLIDSIDEEKSYPTEEDQTLKLYFRVLKQLVTILNEIDVDIDSIKDIISDKFEESSMQEVIEEIFDKVLEDENGLSDSTVRYWNKFVQDKLDYYSLFKELDSLQKIIDEFKIPNIQEQTDVLPRAREVIQNMARMFASNKTTEQSKLNIFDPMSNEVTTVVKNSLDSFLNSGNKLSTGIRGLDDMIGGGLQNGRCYLMIGAPKHFKSGVMLNLTLNIASTCKNWITKNEGMIPTVMYYTMENSLNETLERVYNYFGIPFDFEYEEVKNSNGFTSKKYKLTPQEINSVIDTIQKETYEKTGICFMIMYDNSRTTDTNIFYNIYDDLLIQGKELIFLAQDYIKKIRSVQNSNGDNRYELGYVVDEFCTFAKEKDIPVLTVHQYNRQGMKVIEETAESKRKDVGRKLNASMVGDSNLVLENADVSISVDREFDEDTNQVYETFKILLARIKYDPNFMYMAQPFDPDPKYKGFRIARDVDQPKALYKTRISSTEDPNDIRVNENSNDAIKKRFDKKKASKSAKEILEEAEEQANVNLKNLADIENEDDI